MSHLELVTKALVHLDETNDFSTLFTLVSEDIVWTYAKVILDDPELHYSLGPTLLQCIDEAFTTIKNYGAVGTFLHHIIGSAKESVIYQSAQHIVLHYANNWEKRSANQFYKDFEETYQNALDGGDQFIAVLALEGAVLLPIFRADDGLLHRAMWLLLDEFPPIPEEAGDPAYLPVKALKLLGYCYDKYPHDRAIIAKVNLLTGQTNTNYSLIAEAHFALGIISLYNAFQASDEASFFIALTDATKNFESSATAVENRSDAELFATIIQCYVLILRKASVDAVKNVVEHAKGVLTERLLAFGGVKTSDDNEIEFRCVQMVMYLENWVEALTNATQWPDLKPSLQVLANIYAAVRQFTITQGFMNDISQTTQELVMVPYLLGKFVLVQEIISKMRYILSDVNWREKAALHEVAFGELLLQALQDIPSPKELAATELEKVRLAAEREDPALARSIADSQKSGKDITETLVQLAWEYLNRKQVAIPEIPFHEGPAKEICENLISELREKLAWDVRASKWIYLVHSIRLIANYLVRLYRITPGEATPTDVSFLFAEGIKNLRGLGQKAVEKDLENHFYSTMYVGNTLGSIERQPMSIAPGKPDLCLNYRGDIKFPIEIKRESHDISRTNICDHYVAQSQSYGAALYGVSFLFVLDLTPKPLKTPLPNVVECCYLDHRPVPNAMHTDYVIVVIFPANRPRPSDHSWGKKKD